MAKFAIHGFVLVIVIAVIYGKQFPQESLEFSRIKEDLKDELFMHHLMDCMYDTHLVQVGVCHSTRMRLAKVLLGLAYQYDEITHKCLTGENDPPLDEACELYQLLNNIYPQYWEQNLVAIKHSVERKKQILNSLPKNTNLIDMLVDHGAVGVAVTKCMIDRASCFSPIVTQIKEIVAFAEIMGNCPKPAHRKSDVCRLYFAFQKNYPSLYEEIKNRDLVYQYDEEKGTVQVNGIIRDEL